MPGRLYLLKTVDGVEIYNDTNSTTPEATMVALQALSSSNDSDKKRVVLIMGGSDKGLQMDALLAEIKKAVKRVILLSGTGTERIRASLPEAEVYENLAMAFSSFGMFANEYDRGDQFDQLVNTIS